MSDNSLLLIVKNEREVRVAEKLGFQATSDRDAIGKWKEVLLNGIIAVTRSSVKFVELPNARSLSAWSGTREDLLRLIDDAPDWEPKEIQDAKMIPASDEDGAESPEKSYPKWPYLVLDGRICVGKELLVGLEIQYLCNFNATIKEDRVRDDGNDGIQMSRFYRIEGTLATGEELPAALVPASQFRSMNWIEDSWGARANISAGNGNRDKLREGIKALSDSTERRTYCHTGWREIDCKHFYLSHRSAIGSEGFTDRFDVDLGELRAYSLPPPPQRAEDIREAMQASLRLLNVGSLSVTSPLWATVFRAPLSSILKPPPAFTPWAEAPTGRFKSTLSALFACHYGDFDTNSLPGSWRSTANSLAMYAHILKDCMFVIDDFSRNDHAMHAKAAEFCRAQGNLSSRGGLKSNLNVRPSFPPRGITLSTGETHPSGDPGDRSLQARIPIIEFPPDAVNTKLLTEAQRRSELLLRAMSGYVQFLAGLLDSGELPKEEDVRDATRWADGQLLFRMSEALSNLFLGIEWGLRYAKQVGAIADVDADKLRGRCLEAFRTVAADQNRLAQGEQPTRMFLERVSVLIDQHQLILQPKNQDARRREKKRKGSIIGYFDVERIYLPPEVTYGAVRRLSRDVGETFPVSRNRLFKDMRDERLAECDADRTLKMVNLGGSVGRRRMLVLRIEAVDQLLGIPLWPR